MVLVGIFYRINYYIAIHYFVYDNNKMSIQDIIISKTSLIIGAFLVVLTIVNFLIMYFIKKKQKEKLQDSKEYKSIITKLQLKKPKMVKVAVKPEKLVEDKLESFKILKGKSKFSWIYWKEWYLLKYRVGSAVLVNMELLNGFHRLFIVKEKEEGFVFRGKKYLFDDESKYYNIDAKLYTFDYHEGLVLPVKRKIPLTTIKKTLESTEGIDIEYAINPSTLQRFMTAKIAEGVMKGTQLDEFFRKINMFIIVIMVAVLVHLALFLYASGILQNIPEAYKNNAKWFLHGFGWLI